MTGNPWELDPKGWSLQYLIQQGKKGTDPLFDGKLAERALRLNELRQRIHLGRYWFVGSNRGDRFDLRPEEAREARETLDQILRELIRWLELHPAVENGAKS